MLIKTMQYEHLFPYSGPDSQASLILSPRPEGLVSFSRNSNLVVEPEQPVLRHNQSQTGCHCLREITITMTESESH